MDLSAISTYRCNSRCSMCNIWRHPSLPAEEISLATLEKLPAGFDNLNLTGGEPTLRRDLSELVDVLHPKARILEISSNGLRPELLEPIVRKYPGIKIRFSLEGFGATNNLIRGEKDGFAIKMAGLRRLQQAGGQDLGLAITIQDDNAPELVKLYEFAAQNGFELATSALHNGFQFHKSDNWPYDRLKVAREIEGLITAQLRSFSVKNWFRAYLNLGLIAKVLGHDRLIPCAAATDFMFIDPWAEVYACNVRPDLRLGNLEADSWETIYHGERATAIRQQVAQCTQNCWMVGSARTAMRNPRLPQLPRLGPLLWVLENRLRVGLGLTIKFEQYVNYTQIHVDGPVPRRVSHLENPAKATVETRAQAHYQDEYVNR